MKKSVVVAYMALLVIELLMVKAATGFDCQAAKQSLVPCIGYLFGGGGPSKECCGGVRSLKDSTTTQVDRRAACECLKAAASQYPDIKSDLAAALPTRCDVQLSFPISKDMNCSNIPSVEGNGEKMKLGGRSTRP